MTLRGANLNKIIQLLVPETGAPDLKFMKIFMVTYQSFTTPKVFLKKLIERFPAALSLSLSRCDASRSV